MYRGCSTPPAPFIALQPSSPTYTPFPYTTLFRSQREQVGVDAFSEFLPLRPGLGDLLVEFSERLITFRLNPGDVGADRLELLSDGLQFTLGVLQAFHHLQLHVLQVALALGE